MKLLALLATFITVVPSQLPPRAAGSDKLTTLASDLRKAHDENSSSFQRYAWRVHHILQESVEGKEWRAVATALNAQGIAVNFEGTEGSMRNYRCLVKGTSFSLPSGLQMNLELKLDACPDVSRTKPTKTRTRVRFAQLVAKVEMPLKDVLAKEIFPQGVILKTLERPGLKRLAAKYQMVSQVSVEYRQRGMMLGTWNEGPRLLPSGFSVWVDLENRTKYSSEGARLTYWANSELDPLREYGKPPNLRGGFVPKDIIGEVQPSDGISEEDRTGSTWSGGPVVGQSLEKIGESAFGLPPKEPEYAAYSPADLKTLPSNITSLRMVSSEMYDQDLKLLSRFKGVRHLEAWWAEGNPNHSFRERSLAVIGQMKQLRKLEFSSGVVGNTFSKVVASLPELRELRYHCERITDTGIIALSKARKLEKLAIGYCEKATDLSLASISKMTKLTSLNLPYGADFTDNGLRAIGKLIHLRELTISDSKRLTHKGLSVLSKLPNIESLSLQRVAIDDRTVRTIADMGNIRTLTFYEVKGLTNKSILALAKLRKLRWLYFHECRGVTPEGVEALKPLLNGKFDGP